MSRLSLSSVGATLAAAMTVAVPAQAGDPSAAEVMQKAEQARRVQDLTARATLITQAGDRTKTKTFTLKTALADDGVHYKTFARFHTPAVIRNEAVLIVEGPDGNDVHLYLPRYKKIRRVESSSQSGSFMGSVFSYSDMTVQHAKDWDHDRLRKEPCPGETTVTCQVIESTPKTSAVRTRTGYGKAVQWVREDHWVVVRGEFYGTDGALKKVATGTDVKQVSRENDRWMALTLRVEDAKTKRFTVLRLRHVQVDQGIPDAVFTHQNLSREE